MTDSAPKIAILPYGVKLGLRPSGIALERLNWPLGKPGGLAGKCLRDLGPDDHLIIFPGRTMHLRPSFGTSAKVSVMMLEPSVIHRKHLDALRRSHKKFHRVLTCNEDLLTIIPNGILFPLGGTWVPEWRELTLEKTRMCSLIASAKRSQEGHVLRHAMVDWARAEGMDVEAMGGAYHPFEAKAEGLAPYRYSVVIENVRERHYFSEKLIDALLCKTVPIYWGCPNIADYLDTSSMIICETEAALRRALRHMSKADYQARLPALEAAQTEAETYADYERRAALAVLQSSGQMP